MAHMQLHNVIIYFLLNTITYYLLKISRGEISAC